MKLFFKGFKKGMKNFGDKITVIVNTILLTVTYLVGVGLTSIAAKIVGKKFLGKNKSKESYWSDLDLKKEPIEKYYRQF